MQYNKRLILMLPITLVVLFSIAIVSGVSYENSKKIIKNTIAQSYRLTQDEMRSRVVLSSARLVDFAAVIAKSPMTRNLLREDAPETVRQQALTYINGILNSLAAVNKESDNMIVFNAQGVIVADVRGLTGVNLAEQCYYQSVMQGRSVRGVKPHFREGFPILYVAEPIKDGDKILGAVFLTMDMKFLSATLEERVNPGLQTRIALVDSQGNVAASSHESLPVRTRYDMSAKRTALMASEGEFVPLEDTPPRLGMRTSIPELGLTLLFSMDERALFAPAHALFWSALASSGLAGLVTIFTVYILVAYFLRRQERSDSQVLAQSLALQHERALLKNVIDNIPDYVFFKNAESRLMGANRAFYDLYGYTEAQLSGELTLSEKFIRTASLKAVESFYEQDNYVFRTGEMLRVEETISRRNAEPQVLETVKTPMRDKDGNIFGLVGISRDISLRREMEQAVLRAEKASAANMAKSAFLSTMSHEIRTPMNAVVGFIHLFDRSNLTTTQLEYLEKIRLSSATLLKIINDVLDISKIEAGKMDLETIPFNLKVVLDTVSSIVGFAAREKNIEFTVDMEGAVPEFLLGDPTRINQILLNLANNAVKFTPHGSIRLHISCLAEPPATAEKDGGALATLEFKVTDTGIGMSEEQLERLFQPFSQADSSVARRYGGTGLGLSICKHLVELMGGSIDVASLEGKGSTFSFSLQLAVAAAPHAAPEASGENGADTEAAMRQLAGSRVLVVDDNLINQEIARALIEQYGVAVDTAGDGQEAVDMLLLHRYSMIFMDMQMPVLDGLQATRRIRELGQSEKEEQQWLASVPVVAMTANVMQEDRERCHAAGMNAHIGKPIAPEELRQCLLRHICGIEAA